MANFAPGGFSQGYSRTKAVLNEQQQIKVARQKQIQDRLMTSLQNSEKASLDMFNQQVKLIGEAAQNGATADQVQQMADHAVQPLQAHATVLQQLRAQATQAGATPDQLSILPDPKQFIGDHIGVLQSAVETALTQTPEGKIKAAVQGLKNAGVDATPEQVAQALGMVKPDVSGTQQIREGQNFVTRRTVNGQPDMSQAGIIASSPIKESAQTITMLPAPPSGMAYEPDPNSAVGFRLIRVPGAPPPGYTEAQNKSYQLATRMRELSGDVVNEAPNITSQVLAKIAQSGGVVGAAANLGLSEQEQKHFNAARGWLAGVLRQDTGATIQPFEIQEYYPTFFPVPGDSPGIVEQKRRLREVTENAMAANAGRPLKAPPEAIAYLKEHPEFADQFKAKYGYLPE